MDEPYELILAVFGEIETASEAYAELLKKKKAQDLSVFDMAVIGRDAQGDTKLKEAGDVDASHGAVFGAIVGGLLGLIGGPFVAVVGAASGAVAGGVVAGRIDMGFSDDFLNNLAEALQPERSALLVLSEAEWIDSIVDVLEGYSDTILRNAVREELVERLVKAQEE